MLQKLNERIQGVVAWVIIILIAVTFTLFGVDYYVQSHQRADAEVTVNGEPISHQALDVNYRRSRQMREPAQFSVERDKELKQQVINEMIVNTVSMQNAAKFGFVINPEQAQAAILAIPQFQQDGHFSPERYQQSLSGALFTPETFFQEVTQGMLLNQVRFAMMGTAFVLPSELKRFVKLYMQTRDYAYLTLPARDFEKAITIASGDIDHYYQQHPSAFMNPEKVSVEYVRLSATDVRKTIRPSEKEIAAYYKENQMNYKLPTQWKVAQIYFAYPDDASVEQKQAIAQKANETALTLKNHPEKFSEMLTKLTDDKLSVSRQGELPWITAGQTYMDKGLLPLKKPGQISEPFVSSKGIQIFKLMDYRAAQIKPLAEVAPQIKAQLIADATQRLFADKVEKMTELAFQTPDTLEPIARELNLPLQSSLPFSRKGSAEGIASNKQVVNTAFSHDVLELANNSEPLQLNSDTVLVLRLRQHIPASKRSLDEVRDTIRQKLVKKEAEEKAAEWGKALMSGQQSFSALQQYLQGKAPQWKAITAATRELDSVPAVINNLAFSMASPQQQEGKQVDNGDFVIVKLKAIHDGDLQRLDPEQKAAIQQQLESSYGMIDYDLYVAGAMKTADIVR
ncbi:MAG: SurA N-terminal domain-containing protein [Legionellaceae bacterium]|nr:SurA N-terminal domain-containing protein [Legionellaceae bacterium]